MPYMVAETGTSENPWCVYRKGEDGGRVGDTLGCHESRKKAQAQIAAIWASEGARKSSLADESDATISEAWQESLRWYAQRLRSAGDMVPVVKAATVVTAELLGRGLGWDPGSELAIAIAKGGPGSGHWGHAGRPGEVGGSLPTLGEGSAMSIAGGRTASARQAAARQGARISNRGKAVPWGEVNPPAMDKHNLAIREMFIQSAYAVAGKDDPLQSMTDEERLAFMANEGAVMPYDFAPPMKANVVAEIATSNALQAAAKEYGDMVGDTWSATEAANESVAAWAASSGDEHLWSVAMQQAAADRWGLDAAAYIRDGERERAVLTDSGITSEAMASLRTLQGAVVDDIYTRTQSSLEQAGVETLRLYRGVGLKTADVGEAIQGETLTHTSNPLSSWSLRVETAQYFAANSIDEGIAVGQPQIGVVLAIEVPRERVFSIAVTGVGALSENEVVLIGGVQDDAMIVRTYG